jgi:hypothetical protein
MTSLAPLIDAGLAHKESSVALSDMVNGTSQDDKKLILDWINSRIVLVQSQMVDCNPANLPEMQTRIKQLSELRFDLLPQKYFADSA